MYLDAIKDAAYHADRTDKLNEAAITAEISVAEQITETFTKTIRIVPHFKLCVPYVNVSHLGGVARIRQMGLAEAAEDVLGYPEVFESFMGVLANSDCPHVQGLRLAIAAKYCDLWASEVAEVQS